MTNIDNELLNFYDTIEQLRPDLKENIINLKEHLCRSAPEIRLERYWWGIYNLLKVKVVVKVDVQDNNRIIFDKYHELYEKHSKNKSN